MISQRSHALLSEIHRVLSEYSSEEFRSASAFSEQLKDALLLLADKVGKVAEISSYASDEPVKRPGFSRRPPTNGQFNDAEEVENFLRRLGTAESSVALAKINRNQLR